MNIKIDNVERETFGLINLIRTNPSYLIPDLERLAKSFQGKSYRMPGTDLKIVTVEGRAAVDEAIAFLKVDFLRTGGGCM